MMWLQEKFWMTLAVVAVLFGVYGAGSRAAKNSEALRREQHQKRVQEKLDELDSQMDAMPDDDVLSAARRWVRNGA